VVYILLRMLFLRDLLRLEGEELGVACVEIFVVGAGYCACGLSLLVQSTLRQRRPQHPHLLLLPIPQRLRLPPPINCRLRPIQQIFLRCCGSIFLHEILYFYVVDAGRQAGERAARVVSFLVVVPCCLSRPRLFNSNISRIQAPVITRLNLRTGN